MANSTVTNQKTIQNNQLTPGAIILVRGNIEYSHLVNKIEGEELEQDKIRKSQAGGVPIDKPYTTATITNARVIPLNPSAKTLDEIYVEERFYKRLGDPADAPYHFTINNKSPYPNSFYQARPNSPTEGDQFIPEGELAGGLDVILVLRVFQAKAFQHKGITLNSIILQEPVQYFRSTNTKQLESAGIILHSTPAAQAPMNPAPAAAMPPIMPQAAPQAAQVSAPAAGTAFTANPQTAAQTAPATPATPASTPWTCPKCGNQVPANMKFCGNCGAPKADQAPPVPQGNPYANARNSAEAAAQNGSTIRYDANDTNRNY